MRVGIGRQARRLSYAPPPAVAGKLTGFNCMDTARNNAVGRASRLSLTSENFAFRRSGGIQSESHFSVNESWNRETGATPVLRAATRRRRQSGGFQLHGYGPE